MINVQVNGRLGVTSSVIPHKTGFYPIWFNDSKSVEFINSKSVSFMDEEFTDNPLFRLSVVTPFSLPDIYIFICLSGMSDIKEVEILLKRFRNAGIKTLKDVNILCQLGYFNCKL